VKFNKSYIFYKNKTPPEKSRRDESSAATFFSVRVKLVVSVTVDSFSGDSSTGNSIFSHVVREIGVGK